MNSSLPNKLSTLCDSLFQQAVDDAIEQHRINGREIAVSDRHGKVKTIPATDITPLADKLQQRKNSQFTTT